MKRYINMNEEQYNAWRLKLSIAHKGKSTWNKGKKCSLEHKNKLRESRLKHLDKIKHGDKL
jgi:hypothetical protein